MKLTASLAKKSLGQNFLHDKNVSQKIVRCLQIQPDDDVIEIGPGPGALSTVLYDHKPRQLLLVEKDYRWAMERHDTRGGGCPQVVVLGDALRLAWESVGPSWKIIGNLPYNIASPLMWEIFSRSRQIRRAVFMIQKEVGERIVAKPGTKAYGALSVWIQSFVVPKLEFIVPPDVFIPRPKVYSAVLSFTPRPPADTPPPEEAERLAVLLHRCFQQRRKQLGTILKTPAFAVADRLAAAGISPTLRPEALSPETFRQLLAVYKNI